MTNLHAIDSTVAIESLIPHRPPMVLLDRVIAVGPQQLLAHAELTPDAPFCSASGVPACIGLEYLGQAAAAFFSTQEPAGTTVMPPRPGLLIASRSYTCSDGYFPASHHLLIDIEPASAVGLSGLVKFRGALHVLNPNDTHHLELLQNAPAKLDSLCAYLAAAEPFAQGDLSVYLPPFENTPEPNQS